MPAPCAGIFLHANYSPFDGRYGADGGPIHATCTPDCRPIRKAPAQPNATPPASDGARPNRFTTRVCRSRRPKRTTRRLRRRAGKNLIVARYSAEGREDRYPELCREVVGTRIVSTVAQPSVLWDGRRFEMWYASFLNFGGADRRTAGYGYAVSTDGIQWTKPESQPVFVTKQGSGEEAGLYTGPFVLRLNRTYWLFYPGMRRMDPHEMVINAARWNP